MKKNYETFDWPAAGSGYDEEYFDHKFDIENSDDDFYDEDEKKRKRSNGGEDRLDAMDKKLKAMRDLIIDETATYFNHHNEQLNPLEAKNMRSELADRLATAYSLDKMRKAISRLKQSIALQRTLEQNLLEPNNMREDYEDDKKKAKRVAVKKEKVEFDNNK